METFFSKLIGYTLVVIGIAGAYAFPVIILYALWRLFTD